MKLKLKWKNGHEEIIKGVYNITIENGNLLYKQINSIFTIKTPLEQFELIDYILDL